MSTSTIMSLLVASAALATASVCAFTPSAPTSTCASSRTAVRMALNAELTKSFPRDFKNIPFGTDYGSPEDKALNEEVEGLRLQHLESELTATLKAVVEKRKTPVFTTALIAGDCVLLDAIAKAGLLEKIPVLFIDTYHLFPETLDFLKEVEAHYGFKAKTYACADCATQEDFFKKYGEDFWLTDIDEYDLKCKVEPLQRALKESGTDAWINGRRRDHGAERAALPVWEGNKVNPIAFWTFEDCWTYLRAHNVPYHPLHDVGFSSLGDMQSTRRVPLDKWMTYGGERSGRFQGMANKDGSAKTECGIHTEIKA